MFILILQAIWLYIKDLAGKDLDYITIAKFMMYTIPVIVPLALPLSILLASIMVFGNFSEHYEFAAMKSNGISLQRAMRSLTIIIAALSITAFFFANSVIPWGNLKQLNLKNNIKNMAPSMAIGEGSFNQLGDINIKVNSKSGENREFLEGVIIHKKNPKKPGNYTVVKSERGELKSSLKSNIVQLILYNGNYYDELNPEHPQKRRSSPFVKSYFKSYTINVDVSENNNVDLNEERVSDNHKMLKINELNKSIDSFTSRYNSNLNQYRKVQHSKWSPAALTLAVKDSTMQSAQFNADYFKELPAFSQKRSIENAINKIKSQKSALKNRIFQMGEERKRIAKHKIEIHKKFVLGIACVILFFIGAPLGAIIRKGGMGLPMVIAVIFFLAYHFIGIFAEKSAAEGAFPPWLGAWLGTLIIFPIGIFLTYRATTDQGFLNLSEIKETISKWFKKSPKTTTSAG